MDPGLGGGDEDGGVSAFHFRYPPPPEAIYDAVVHGGALAPAIWTVMEKGVQDIHIFLFFPNTTPNL